MPASRRRPCRARSSDPRTMHLQTPPAQDPISRPLRRGEIGIWAPPSPVVQDEVVDATVKVALEVGSRRTFATALDWPGWCRAGRDEDSALDALLAYAPRYAAVLGAHVQGFEQPRYVSAVEVVERNRGDASTEFGAPGTPPGGDERPSTSRDLARLEAILRACWAAFDAEARSAEGVELRTGPRGGGATSRRSASTSLSPTARTSGSWVARLPAARTPRRSGRRTCRA